MTTTKRPQRTGIMLAYPTTDIRVTKLGQSFFIQPKFKGERCRVEWFHGEPVLLSSYGNIFCFLEHIQEVLKEFPQLEYDGELYKHGWSQEQINSAANRKTERNPDSIMLEYYIFDYRGKETQAERFLTLRDIFTTTKSSIIHFSKTFVSSYDKWMFAAEEFTNQGYEGVILRNPNAYYETKRSPNLLKFKPTEIDEYTIIGFNEGTGWATGSLGSFLVEDDDGKQFSVGSGKLLTKENRFELWKIKDSLTGKKLIVKHEKIKTINGVPNCSVAFKLGD